MQARNRRGSAAKSALVLTLVAAVGLAATAYVIKFSPSHRSADLDIVRPEPRAPHVDIVAKPSHVEGTDEGDKPVSQSALLAPIVQGDSVTLGASTDQIAPGEEPAVFLANESLKAVHADSAKALGVTVKNRVALLEFNEAIEDGFGSSQEASFLKALQVSLGQLPEVDKFQILVKGQPIESLGHFEVTEPLDVIRPTIKP